MKKPSHPEAELLSADDIAKLLGLTKRAVRLKMQRGRIKPSGKRHGLIVWSFNSLPRSYQSRLTEARGRFDKRTFENIARSAATSKGSRKTSSEQRGASPRSTNALATLQRLMDAPTSTKKAKSQEEFSCSPEEYPSNAQISEIKTRVARLASVVLEVEASLSEIATLLARFPGMGTRRSERLLQAP